jgi:O-antigen/teichoic acid export membrane protein
VATTGLAALIALLAPDLVRIVWGHPVPLAVPVLRVLAVGVVLRSIAALLSAQCQALGAEADAARARLAALVAFGIASIPAARLGGALGLAVAAVASDLLLVARMSGLLRRRAQLRFSVAAATRPLGAILATVALNALAPAMPFWGRAATATATLGLAMFASGSIRLHDLRFLRDILRGRSPA